MRYKEEILLQYASQIKDEKLRMKLFYFQTRANLLARSTKDLGEERILVNGKVI